MLSTLILLVAAVSAAVVQANKARDAYPGTPVVRDIPVITSSDLTTLITVTTTFAPTTTGAVQRVVADIPCTPSSICFDGFTCGQRYGGCYDANFCDGNTSPFSIPTCITTSTTTSIPTIISTRDRVIANDDAMEEVEDVMEEELEDGSADAIVGPGTGN